MMPMGGGTRPGMPVGRGMPVSTAAQRARAAMTKQPMPARSMLPGGGNVAPRGGIGARVPTGMDRFSNLRQQLQGNPGMGAPRPNPGMPTRNPANYQDMIKRMAANRLAR